MPTISSKTRQTIKARFVQNAIPTQDDYADLINASLNQADDGIYKLPDEPLSIVGKTATPPVLRFYGDASATTWAWQIQLSADNKAGFALVSGDNQTRLFFDTATGNVGIGTTAPTAKLQVAGSLGVTGATNLAAVTATGATNLAALTTTGNITMSTNAFYLDSSTKNIGIGTTSPGAKLTISGARTTKDPDSGMSWGGQLAIKGGAPQIDFIDTDANNNDWSIYVDSNKLYFIRQPWEYLDLVLDGTGKVGIGTDAPAAKLHVAGTLRATDATTLAGLTAGTTTLAALTTTGATSLAAVTTSGNITMSTDAFYLDNTSKNIGIGTSAPTAKLHVAGTLRTTDATTLAGLTAGTTTLASLTTTGATSLSALTTTGIIAMSTDAFYLNNTNKKIGIGTTNPLAKLHIIETNGTAASATAGSLLIDHDDVGGASSIVFRSKGDATDFAYLEYKEKTIGTNQAGLLTLSIQNDSDDHIALMPSGNVGIGTTTPTSKLHVAGTLAVNGAASLTTLTTGSVAIGTTTTPATAKLQVVGGGSVDTLSITGGATGTNSLSVAGPTSLSALTTSGNVGIGTTTIPTTAKLHIVETPNGTAASATTGSILIEHNNAGGASSIVFRSKADNTDYAYLEYKESITGTNQPGLLTLSIQNDVDDHIALIPSGNVGIGTTTPNAKLQVAGSIYARGLSGPINDYTKAHYTLSGGGTIRWTKTGLFTWSHRFICISMGSTSIIPHGHINIRYPDASKLTAWDGTARLTSEGIQLRAWEALYAIHTMELHENAVTYRIVVYNQIPEVPINWILVAVMNDDDKSLKLGTGITIAPGASVTHGCPLPCGTIMMWSGQAADIPTGWSVCDGTNGTPNLQGRFILGSGQGAGLTSRTKDNLGGRETVTLTTTEMPSHSHAITDPGHSHTWTASRQLPGIDDSNYSSELSKGDSGALETMSKTTNSIGTGLSLANTGSGGAFNIMPPFYVLIYIMKSF